jgi:hypothetical protein
MLKLKFLFSISLRASQTTFDLINYNQIFLILGSNLFSCCSHVISIEEIIGKFFEAKEKGGG